MIKIMVIFLVAVVAVAIAAAPVVAAHEVKPGAYADGLVNPAPEQAYPGQVVWAGSVEVGAMHQSIVTAVAFMVAGNKNATAFLYYDDGKTRRIVAMKQLTGSFEPVSLNRWQEIPSMKLVSFRLGVAYHGKCGDIVPAVRVRPSPSSVAIWSGADHGGYQKVRWSDDTPPLPPSSGNIKLMCKQ